MSGHSRWSKIKRQKTASDQKRGKLFSVLSKQIALAAKSGSDPDTNATLKLALDKAKAGNVPNDVVERAIKKGSGELPGQGPLEEITYEAYGPEGVQFVITATTDNKNRTTSNIRHILTKSGGSISGQGSVLWNFKKGEEGFKAKTTQPVIEALKEKVEVIVSALEEDEDVDAVYTNSL